MLPNENNIAQKKDLQSQVFFDVRFLCKNSNKCVLYAQIVRIKRLFVQNQSNATVLPFFANFVSKNALTQSCILSMSFAPTVSTAECIASCASPISAAFIDKFALVISPIVPPQRTSEWLQ